MTRSERIAMWLLVAGLVVFAYGASLRIDTLQGSVQRLAAPARTTSTVLTSTTQPDPAIMDLRRQVAQLQSNRGLSGPEVRAMLETLLPAPGCVEPPCDAPSGAAASASTTTTVSTTVVGR